MGMPDIRELAAQALHETRELSRLLRPQILDDLGLEPALRWLTRTFGERNGTLRSSTVRTRSTTRSATCSVRPEPCCVNQRRSGTPSGFVSGAASTAKIGDM